MKLIKSQDKRSISETCEENYYYDGMQLRRLGRNSDLDLTFAVPISLFKQTARRQ
jgi:hypothetical protein